MAGVCWPYFDPEYENLSQRINPPRVSIDNTTCNDCTIIKVDSVNRPGILLEVVQVLTDLDLIISKAYISSDGGWFMDVFHVTDHQGNKLTDSKKIEHIEKALGPKSNILSREKSCPRKMIGLSTGNYTAIEIVGTDRPGLLSEISSVFTSHHCNVIAAEVWTHKMHVACVAYINDVTTNEAVNDSTRLLAIEEQLKQVLRQHPHDDKVLLTRFSTGYTHIDRRLHQMMFANKDYEDSCCEAETNDANSCPVITIDRCEDKGYSVVNLRCKDRPKLLFDTVFTLTDMDYVVFHAAIRSDGPFAQQEYYIRHVDGWILDTERERERVIKCLEAAIKRRVSEGVRLELCARDRVGLLSEITRILCKNGLWVTRAGISTVEDQGVHIFYVRDESGNPVEMEAIESIKQEIESTMMLNVDKAPV